MEYVTDPFGRRTKYEYAKDGQIKKTIINYGTPEETFTQSDICGCGFTNSETDELGRKTEYEYNKGLVQLMKRTDPDPDGNGPLPAPVTTYEYDMGGNRIKMTDALGNLTRYVYDAAGQLLYEISPRPDHSTPYTRTIDDEDTDFAKSSSGWTQVESSGHSGDHYYDPATSGTDYASWTFSGLDSKKNYEVFATWVAHATSNAPNSPYTVTNQDSSVSQTINVNQRFSPVDETIGGTAWDRLGVFGGSSTLTVTLNHGTDGRMVADAVRIVEVGPTVKHTYDSRGNVISTADALQRTTTFAYDEQSRQIRVTLPDPDGSGPLPAPFTRTEYYADGQVLRQIDALGNSTWYEYDQLGRQKHVVQSPTTTPTSTKIDDEDSGFAKSTTGWTEVTTAGHSGDHYQHAASTGTDYASWTFSSLDAATKYHVYATWQANVANAIDAPYSVIGIVGSTETVLYTSRANQKVSPNDESTGAGGGDVWERLGFFSGYTTLKVKLGTSTNGQVIADAIRVVEAGAYTTTNYNAAGEITSTVNELGYTTKYGYDARGNQDLVLLPIADPSVTNPIDVLGNDQSGQATYSPNEGAWTAATGGYSNNYHHKSGGSSSDYVEWSLSVTAGKTYEILTTWVADDANAIDAPYQVFDNTTSKGLIRVNQQRAPSSDNGLGVDWQRLMVITPTTGTIKVRLRGDAGDATKRVVADAVRAVEVGSFTKTTYNKAGDVLTTVDAAGSDTFYLYDSRGRLTEVHQPVPDTSITPHRPAPVDHGSPPTGWTEYSDARAYGGSYLLSTSSGSDISWTLPLPTSPNGRTFAVMTTWVPQTGSISGRYKVYDYGSQLLTDRFVEQRFSPDDYVDEDGRWWEVLGVYDNLLGLSSQVTVQAVVGTQADAVRIVEFGPRSIKNNYNDAGELTSSEDALKQSTRYGYDQAGRQTLAISPVADPSVVPDDIVKDNVAGQATFGTNWSLLTTTGYGGTFSYRGPDSASNYVEWSFTVNTTKTYEVLATWAHNPGWIGGVANATDAPYEVLDNTTSEGVFRVNQQARPGSGNALGVDWQRFMVIKPDTTTIKVRVRSDIADSNHRVIADAVRLVEIGAYTTTAYNELGQVTGTTDPRGNTTYFDYDQIGGQTLVIHPPAITPSSPPGPVDNGSASGWTTVGSGYSGGSLSHSAGSGSNTYTWTSATLTDEKKYQVYVTWPGSLTGEATNAPFEIFKSNTSTDVSIGTVYVNQQSLPEDFIDASNNRWRRLGAFALPDGYDKFKVRLSDNANGTVIADAVYFVEAGPVSETRYDAAGQMISSVDPLDRVTSYTYEPAGRASQVTYPDTDVTVKAAYNANGQVAFTKDPLGNVVYQHYDKLGRQTHVIQPKPDGSLISVTNTSATSGSDWVFTPSSGNNLKYQILVNWTAGGSNTTNARFEVLNGTTSLGVFEVNQKDYLPDLTIPTDNPAVGWSRLGVFNLTNSSFTVRLSQGAVAAKIRILEVGPTSETVFNSGDQVTSTIDVLNQTTTIEYDRWGRTIAITLPDPDGGSSLIPAKTVYEYDANSNLRYEKQRVTVGTPDTFLTTEHRYDRLNREVMTIDAAHAGTSVGTSFIFDAVGNLWKITDSEANTTTFLHDNLNRVIRETNQLNDYRTFDYDAAGNRIKKIDRNEQATEWFYDNLGRMTKEKWEQGATDRELTFGYDLAGNMTSADDSYVTGRNYDYVFDEMGRLEETEWTMAGRLYTMINEYDLGSRRTERNLSYDPGAPYYPAPDFIVDNWEYDNLGRMTVAKQEGLAWMLDKSAKFAYNAAGQLTEIKRYNDLTGSNLILDTDYEYDSAGRVKVLTHKNPAGTTTYAGYTYTWDAANRMTGMDFSSTVTSGINDEDATFSYDNSGQLTGAERSGTANDEAYVYDDNGNRDTVSRGGVTNQNWVAGTNNQLTNDAKYVYEYDDEGNRTKRITLVSGNPTGATTEYVWDFRNRLNQVIEQHEPHRHRDATDRLLLRHVRSSHHARQGPRRRQWLGGACD